MRPTVRKEETMPDFMYGVCVGAEGARSGGERSEPERRAPSRPMAFVFTLLKTDYFESTA